MERKAVKDLESNNSIVIHNTDKDGLVVVMNVDMYDREAVRQLSDTC